MDLTDAVTMHQLELDADGRSPHTTALYSTYELAFLEYLETHGIPPTIEALNLGNVREFVSWYRQQGRGNRTRGGEAAARACAVVLKRLGSVLEANGVIDVNPLAKLARPKVAKYVRAPFTAQEISAMWGASLRTQFPARDEALFLLLLDTGMRIGEVTSLRLSAVDLGTRRITVMGKGRRERTIPIGDPSKRDGGRTVRVLRRWLQSRPTPHPSAEPYVFLGRDRRPLLPDGGAEIIRRIGELAGVENVYPHRLRHSFCTWWLTVYPGDEMGLRAIVGHLSKDVLADYVHLSQATIAQRSGRASLVEFLAAPDRPKPDEPETWRGANAGYRALPTRTVVELPVPKAAVDKDALVEAVKADPELRKALLQALVGAD